MTKKRAYGTGSAVELAGGIWQLKYKPKWSERPLYQRVSIEGNKARKQAVDALDAWRKELDEHKAKPVALSIETLHDVLIADYRRRQRTGAEDTSRKWKKHLDTYFRGRDITDLEDEVVDEYMDARLMAKAANGTVNREVSWLHRALVLARKRKLTKYVFAWERLDERAGRV